MSPHKRNSNEKTASLIDVLRLLKSHKGVLFTVSLLSIVSALLNLAQPQLVNVILGRVQHNMRSAVPPLIALVGVFLSGAAITSFDAYLLLNDMRRSLVMHILHLPFKDLDQSHTGNVISIISSDTNELKRLLTDNCQKCLALYWCS